jgi:hypothetical protein
LTRSLISFRMVIVLAAALPAMGQTPAATARLRGKIVDTSGKPVPAARIDYRRVAEVVRAANGRWIERPGEPRVQAAALAGVAGAYDLTQLPAGNYILCVRAPGYLSSCDWGAWIPVKLSAGEDLDFGDIVLRPAAAVTIRVIDSSRALSTAGKSLVPLAIGVLDQWGNFHGATEVAWDGLGRTFQVAVPFGEPLKFWAHSWKYHLTDEEGRALDNLGVRLPFAVAVGGGVPSFVVNIGNENP